MPTIGATIGFELLKAKGSSSWWETRALRLWMLERDTRALEARAPLNRAIGLAALKAEASGGLAGRWDGRLVSW